MVFPSLAELRATLRAPDETAAGGLYRLALQLGPLLDGPEATQGALEACATLVDADLGLLLTDDLPPATLGPVVAGPEAARMIAVAPLMQAAADDSGASLLQPELAPFPAPTIVVALPGPPTSQAVLLLARSDSQAIGPEKLAMLAAALPLVSQTLDRCRRHLALRRAELFQDGTVGKLAHDIRSPLVSTHASLEVVQRLLRGQPAPKGVFDALTHGLRSVQLAVELCNDLLEVSKLKIGPALATRTLALGRLARDTSQLLDPIAGQRGVELLIHEAPYELWIKGDERLLRRMLTNLIVNGLRFAPEGGFVRIECRCGNEPDTALVLVSDNGPGVASADYERIFEPFAQGPGEANRGVGLGLALCREVALAHGGMVRVETPPEGGARFIVSLPTI